MSPPFQPGTRAPFLGFGSEDALRAVGEVLPQGLFTTDREGFVTWWNTAAARITGWSREEAVGQRCSILTGDAVTGCGCGAGPLRCSLATTGRSSKYCSVRTKDGRLVVVIKNAVALHDGDGQPIGALETFTQVDEAQVQRRTVTRDGEFLGLTGRHPAMQDLYRLVALVARSDSTVMILGESGTGKERVAEAIHQLSARSGRPFVRVSCSALNENLLESELFGHVRGAFTGALKDRRGRFQEADGGTLLLDEIGDISPVVQVKLLRVIEQREVERVGDSQPVKVDVRLLCATHRDLRALVEAGRFRADLYFRLAVFPIRVPPLREHLDDLPLLAERFLSRLTPPRRITPDALRVLGELTWPGNVRELQNVLEYGALQAGPVAIEVRHLPPELTRPRARWPAPIAQPLHESEADALDADRRALTEVLALCRWNRQAAARELGVSRVTLWKRMKRLGITGP